MPRIQAYYQYPDDLGDISSHVTDIILCSIHFGPNYIHLNNHDPNDPRNDSMWQNVDLANRKGVDIWLMVGGAGGAFQVMFQDFEKYYQMLHNLIQTRRMITGIDLDVEEEVELEDMVKLVIRLKNDFPVINLSFAPLGISLVYPLEPGMGGFCYQDLEDKVGQHIDQYHAQMYFEDFRATTLVQISKNFDPKRIVVGMMGTQNMEQVSDQIKDMQVATKNTLGGVFVWNYRTKPKGWAQIMDDVLYHGRYTCVIQ